MKMILIEKRVISFLNQYALKLWFSFTINSSIMLNAVYSLFRFISEHTRSLLGYDYFLPHSINLLFSIHTIAAFYPEREISRNPNWSLIAPWLNLYIVNIKRNFLYFLDSWKWEMWKLAHCHILVLHLI